MCGIVGVIGRDNVADCLLEGLRRLEYRGYDSAGIATLIDGGIDRRRSPGKITNLTRRVLSEPLAGTLGIGHTRWATHGVPSEGNAHPHSDGRVAVVHNGIIENFQELREDLEGKNHKFDSDTDTEVVVHLIHQYLNSGESPEGSVQTALSRLQGAFSLAILIADVPDKLFGARRGSPLVIGYGSGEMYLSSDAMALAPMTRRITYLEEGDWVIVTRDGAEVHDATGRRADRIITQTESSGALIGKDDYPHYMLKEIYEQPQVLGDTLRALFNPAQRSITLPPMPFPLKDVDRITTVACGTAYYAGLVAKYWIEMLAKVPVDADIGSEFRYRTPPLESGGLGLFISQSGETADTLAPLRYCREQGQHILSVVNVLESAVARESDTVLPTLAGPEIGVASTKAFTTQLMALACFAINLAKVRGAIGADIEARLSTALVEVPARVSDMLHMDAAIRDIAGDVAMARDVLYLGRGLLYPIAMEGALKLKEVSYIHAEGYAAGEMKHGPIALIDENVPVVVIAPSDNLFEKSLSNMEQVVARGGRVILISDETGIKRAGKNAVHAICMPKLDPFVMPIIAAVPVQLLAYHTAVLKGTDVDQPRNLAKSVTVE
ncbi:MAG: glutamine--fructose-6-phosphate transaminase (isomerizing) [Candidatus Marinimicrobia bacterium]|nr:glutamine--fructose-6-phosphate transaminase (isomerizing) [Candidatus Neomarinimicrobiota bacterium]